MKKIMLFALAMCFTGSLLANPPRFSKELRTLTAWFQGTYDNGSQFKRDTTVQYAEAHVVRIWENLYTEAIWIYEEIVDKNQRPISQRIYRFSDGQQDVYEAMIYELKGMERFAGEYKNTRPFDELDPETDLTGMLECTIYFRKKGDKKYSGGTIGKECGYAKGRAKYVVSTIDVYEDKLLRADRGMGWDDEIVWGPAKESKGFEFKRSVPDMGESGSKSSSKSKSKSRR
jgi:hypothetical protein